MKVLYHEATDETGKKLNVEFLDGGGKLWVVPFGEATEFENVFMANKILEHQKFMGVVEVNFIKTKTGITYDMEDAVKRAHRALLEAEKQCINDYVRVQLESRVRQNYPPLPPTGRAYSCVVKHKTNLLKYGLRPVGWEPSYDVEPVPESVAEQAGGTSMDERMKSLEKLIAGQQKLIEQLTRAAGRVAATQANSNSNFNSNSAIDPKSILAADANPPAPPVINTAEGVDDTYESINL